MYHCNEYIGVEGRVTHKITSSEWRAVEKATSSNSSVEQQTHTRGSMSDTDPRAPKFPVIVKHPTFADVKANFSGNDYLQWGGVTAASFPLGYVFGASRVASSTRSLQIHYKMNDVQTD